MDGECSTHGEMRNSNTILVGRSKVTTCETWGHKGDNIKMDLREIGCEVLDRIHLP